MRPVRRGVLAGVALAVTALWTLWADEAGAACRQALALGLDVSGSVDSAEYRLQLDGLAGALGDPGVVAAFLALPDAPVSLTVFEWSGPDAQRLLVPWRVISGAGDLAEVTAQLRAVRRGSLGPSTAIGAAKGFGAAMLGEKRQCWRRVLDLSGDGMSNTGPRPGSVRPAGVAINGLVIGAGEDLAALERYYRAYVIQGAGAFVERASGFDGFQAAMVRKLKRELQVTVVSAR